MALNMGMYNWESSMDYKDIVEWTSGKHGKEDFYLTQMLSADGLFDSYKQRFKISYKKSSL